ncbi:hypothetical protein F2Q69_00013023 [Brassica cretica]|uniref:Uncharacterized protein n=1 Tax=Brassica cretica TaxID=69181 RepID=A0A8S9QMY2_BRACR|nr:hypothetical protein F2Q69_00013023 [Brassica cretica]
MEAMMSEIMRRMKKSDFLRKKHADDFFDNVSQVQKDAKTKRSSQDVSSATRRPERNPQPDLFSSSTKSLLEKRQYLLSKEKSGFNKSDLLQERSRPGMLLDTPIWRSRGPSKQSREETKPVHSRDDQELLRGALKRMSSPQNITDTSNQIFKDLEKVKRQSTRPSSKATDPRNCSKQEQIIQELKREPSKVIKENETENEFSLFSSQFELVVNKTCDELICFEPVQPSSLVSVSQVSEENSAEEAQKSSPPEEVLEQPNIEAETDAKSLSLNSQGYCKDLHMVNSLPEMFVMVSSSDVKCFGLEKVKEFCVSNSVFDNMIHSFKKLEPDKFSEEKGFSCDSDINPGLVLSFDQFMEHNKSFQHPEKSLELILQQLVFCSRKSFDSFVFKENNFILSGSKHKIATGKESLVFDPNKGMCCIDNSGYLVSVLSVQEQHDQSQRSKSKHYAYQPEIWRWKNNMTSLKGAKANTMLINQRFGDGST